jgi:zona occludens toxin
MIIFHEGMPRSGKSYAAMKDHIIPALKKGRAVYARLNGLNYPQIADLAGLDEARCRELLVEITEEQVPNLDALAFPQDCFIVIDELQNYFPDSRGQLKPEIRKWIAEHGHHGWDVLIMGQVLKDCHKNWINRTNRKVQFYKKDVVGKDNEYKWVMYNGTPDKNGNVKFNEVSSGDAKYDPAYFGTYKSHSDGTENKGVYSDERANVFKTPFFRKWLPIYAVVALVALGVLINFFNGGMVPDKPAPVTTKPESAITATAPAGEVVQVRYEGGRPVAVHAAAMPARDVALQPEPPLDLIDDLTTNHRIRATGFFKFGSRSGVLVEWYDADRIYHRLNDEQIRALGWVVWVAYDQQLVRIEKAGKTYVATSWPQHDQEGRVSVQVNQRLREEAQPLPEDRTPLIRTSASSDSVSASGLASRPVP